MVRRKDFIDNAIPSGNSVATDLLLRLSKLTTTSVRHQAAHLQPHGIGHVAAAHRLWAFACALNDYLSPSQEIAIVGDAQIRALQALLAEGAVTTCLARSLHARSHARRRKHPPLLEGRTRRRQTCRLRVRKLRLSTPVTEVEGLREGCAGKNDE
ncbi:MAG: hypothetical protein R2873_28315 [Caldilineaceae bacterium]